MLSSLFPNFFSVAVEHIFLVHFSEGREGIPYIASLVHVEGDGVFPENERIGRVRQPV